jgi:hypothetical protein
VDFYEFFAWSLGVGYESKVLEQAVKPAPIAAVESAPLAVVEPAPIAAEPVDWTALAQKLPCDKGVPEQAAERKRLFIAMDADGRGTVTVPEFTAALQGFLGLSDNQIDFNRVVEASFTATKQITTPQGEAPSEVIKLKEFRLLLEKIRDAFASNIAA